MVDAKEFDIIEFSFHGKKYKGVLLPSPKGLVTIKLSSGYNINILPESMSDVKVVGRVEKHEMAEGNIQRTGGSGKPIGMVMTGGTIASKVDYRTGGVHGLSSIEELLEMVPELENFATVSEVESPFVKMSEDIEINDYVKMAESIYMLLKKNEGVVVLHGTDTMHFSSAMMSFMLKTGKPVVFTGSQRSTDRPSTDAWQNMVCSAITATYDISGVGICMHANSSDDYCFFLPGTKARKMHTSRRDAFRPVNARPWLKVWPSGKVEELSEIRRRNDDMAIDTRVSDRVAMVETYPSADPDVLDFYAGKGVRGIIIKATALGHVPTFSSKSWIEKIRELSDKIFIGIASQTLYGSTHPYVYTNLRLLGEAGATFLGDMLPETAYVKLAWVLGHEKELDKIREMMLENIAGEISCREEADEFLW